MMKKAAPSTILVSLGIFQFACSGNSPGNGDDHTGTGGAFVATGGDSSASGGQASGPGGSGGVTSSGGAGPSGTGGGGVTSTGGAGTGGGDANPGTGGSEDPGTGGSAAGAGGSDPGSGGSDGTGGSPPVDEPSLVTSAPGNYWKVGEVTEGGSSATVTVRVDQELQRWDGFGGTFNEAGWDALKALSEADRALAIRLLFDPYEGAGFTFGRIPIGSSDYGLDRYSLNDTAGDFEMANFSIERDRRDLIPYIQAARAVKPDIRFWASPWSPPPWMKNPVGFDGGSMKDDAATLDAHALYLARFVEEYEKEGIYVEAVHPQNEPGFEQGYPSCRWSAGLMTKYIAEHLGPLFAERLPDREVWLGTMSNSTSQSIVTSVMGNQTARGFVDGIGLQWGQVDFAGDYVNNYDVPVMQTEHQCGNNPWEGHDQSRAPNDHAYAVESWGRIVQWLGKGVNSYLAWNMVLDTIGHNLDTSRIWAQNALLAVDRNAKQLVPTPTYYVFRHLAQYVEPGSVRLGTQGGNALAFKNPDGSVVTILYNSGNGPSQVTLSVGGTMLQFEIPGSGWATVNWEG